MMDRTPKHHHRTQKEWTDPQIADFWDWASRQAGIEEKYFTKIYGEALARVFPKWVAREGTVLDYGCGRGDFIARLLSAGGYRVAAADSSPATVADVTRRFADQTAFVGAVVVNGLPSELPADHFDAATFFETIEHLRKEQILPTLKELGRLLKPGGRLILTTPNDENLEASHVYCPFCRSEFHRMQHFNRFDVGSMKVLLGEAGFRVLRCEGLDLHRFAGAKAAVMSFLRYDLRNALGSSRTKPNLVAVAEKC